MTTGNSGVDGIIDRHEESRNALKIWCHQTIHLNFATALIYSSMIWFLPWKHHKKSNSSDVEIIRIYHAWCWPPSGSSCSLSSLNGCLSRYSANSRLWNTKYLAFIVPQVFESVKEEYFSLKLTALKKHKSQSQRVICARSVCVQLLNSRQQVNRDLGEGFLFMKWFFEQIAWKPDLYMYGRSNIAMVSEYVKA